MHGRRNICNFTLQVCSKGILRHYKCHARENASSNINEVIRPVLNSLFFYFYKKISQVQKAQNRLQRTETKNVYKKHLSININEVIKTIKLFS